eukprot:361026-Chlamydomonas_euryale.AAC.6
MRAAMQPRMEEFGGGTLGRPGSHGRTAGALRSMKTRQSKWQGQGSRGWQSKWEGQGSLGWRSKWEGHGSRGRQSKWEGQGSRGWQSKWEGQGSRGWQSMWEGQGGGDGASCTTHSDGRRTPLHVHTQVGTGRGERTACLPACVL